MPRQVEDFLGTYLDYTQGHEGINLVHYTSALSIISAALERKCWIDRGYFKLYPNLYVIIVGDPGTKKSSSTQIALELLRASADINFIEDCLTPASLITTLRNSEKTFMNPVLNQYERMSPAYVYSSELSVLLTDIGGGNILTLLTNFYDSGPKDPNTPWIKKTIKDGTIEIFGPQLSMLGCSTKEWLIRSLPGDAIGGGFTSRIIFCVIDETPAPVPYPSPKDAALFDKLCQTLKHINTLAGPFRETPEAREAYAAWYTDFMIQELPECPDERFKGYAARKGDTVLKLAMVFSASERDDMLINERDLGRAVIYLHTLEQSMFKAFGAKGMNDRAEFVQSLFYQIPVAPDKISYSELMRKNWRHTNPDYFRVDIQTLVESKLVTHSVNGTGERYYQRALDIDITEGAKNLRKFEQTIVKGNQTDHRVTQSRVSKQVLELGDVPLPVPNPLLYRPN